MCEADRLGAAARNETGRIVGTVREVAPNVIAQSRASGRERGGVVERARDLQRVVAGAFDAEGHHGGEGTVRAWPVPVARASARRW